MNYLNIYIKFGILRITKGLLILFITNLLYTSNSGIWIRILYAILFWFVIGLGFYIERESKEKKMEIIKIKYFDDTYGEEGLQKIGGCKSDWIDLRSAEDVELKAGEFKLISLGVAMQLPDGYEAHVVPRSSTFKTFKILQTNCMGVFN